MDHPAKPLNFRPILVKSDNSKKYNLYRSNSPDDGKLETILWLKDEMKIRTLIDLREPREFHPASKLELIYKYSTKSRFQIPAGNLVRYHVKFITLKYHLKVFAMRLSWTDMWKISKLLVRHVWTKDYEFQYYGGKCYVEPLGLGGFYCLLLEDCMNEFKSIFLLLTDESRYPIVIYCSMGKDRTGLTSALVMGLMGYNYEDIVAEYAKTRELLSDQYEKHEKFFTDRGLDKKFAESPEVAMQQVLNYVKEKYGSVVNYLLRCGLTEQDLNLIKTNLNNQINY